MGWILVTNDDGVESPALVPLIHSMARLGFVETVVPDRERSWVGKALTRYEPIRVSRVDRDGLTVHTASGFPADCVQLGLHSLFDEPPALVVSGINIGYNHGSGYIQSSGTVGAALEALLGGVPAAAFSAGTQSRPWPQWRSWVHSSDAHGMWKRLAAIAADIVERLLEVDPPGSVVNVNLPDSATLQTPRAITTVAQVRYDRLFRHEGNGSYVHDYDGGLRWFSDPAGTDVETSVNGNIAITPVTPVGGGAFSESTIRALAKRG